MYTSVIVNAIGIIGFLVFAYKVRKQLLELSNKLDAENITPSDYSLIAFNLPTDKSEDELKEMILERFKDLVESMQLEIVYVNYTYNIEDFIESTAKLTEMYKRRGLVKRHWKSYAKKNNIPEEKVKEDPSCIPDHPPIRVGLCKKIEL